MPFYDFICAKCGEVTEARRGVEIRTIPCPACGDKAIRDLPRNIGLSGLPTRGGTVERRYNVSEFQEASADIAYEHEKAERREGRKLRQPSLYKASKARAKKLMAAGIKNVKDAPYASN